MYSASQLRAVSGEVFHESRGSSVLVADHIFDVRSGGVVDHQAVLVSMAKLQELLRSEQGCELFPETVKAKIRKLYEEFCMI